MAAADQGDSEVVRAEGDHEDGTCEWSACRAHQGIEVCKRLLGHIVYMFIYYIFTFAGEEKDVLDIYHIYI